MKIGINITYGVMKNPTGVGNYILNLVQHLVNIDKSNEYIMYYRYGKVKREYFRNYGCCNKFFEPRFSWLNIFDKIDVFHDPSFKYVKIPGAKTVITVHDVVVALDKNFSSAHFKKYNLPKLKKSIEKTDRIITVSKFSKNEIIKYFGVPESKIDVIYSGVDTDRFKNSNNVDVSKLPEKYFLFVGNVEFRKNIINLVKAFVEFQKKHKDYYLVIIGKNGYGGEDIRKFIESQNNKNIIELQYVPNDKLGAYYKNSVAFVYPSYYEGFGLPVLEAMASGTVVITSNSTATVEAGGDAAVFVNPDDFHDIAEKMVTVSAMSLEEKNVVVAKGYNHIKNFNWNNTAKETLEVYNRLV